MRWLVIVGKGGQVDEKDQKSDALSLINVEAGGEILNVTSTCKHHTNKQKEEENAGYQEGGTYITLPPPQPSASPGVAIIVSNVLKIAQGSQRNFNYTYHYNRTTLLTLSRTRREISCGRPSIF